jgi:hypothetical protein
MVPQPTIPIRTMSFPSASDQPSAISDPSKYRGFLRLLRARVERCSPIAFFSSSRER